MLANYDRFRQNKPIDLTVFIGEWPFRHTSRAGKAELKRMEERLQLSYQCVSHLSSVFGYDTWSGNEALFRELEGDSGLLPFVIINPSESGWERELEWCRQAGAKGIRLTPGYHRYSLRHEGVRELRQAARAYRLPLALSTRLMDERLQHPAHQAEFTPVHEVAEWLEAAHDHPHLVSGYRIQDYRELVRYFPDRQAPAHALFDLWFVNGPIGVIAALEAEGLQKRFAYGSCYPVQTAEATALQLAAAAVSEESRSLLCQGNAAAWLNVL